LIYPGVKVVCDNCEKALPIRTAAQIDFYQKEWRETLTQDLCRDCNEGELNESVKRMVEAENRLKKEFALEPAKI
jgi:hypothetical protein